ncbi:hypothetical protein BCU70_19525 [Vibrio sp. 10N.286.49.C2]|uniref:DUF6515 family protein n=1 Tax=unclassified Vibrio TaxID=2614977 RepID=UPI000C8351BA|nr:MULTISPECIES: DUF6515 family protein [unclassified Vibrio]PMH34852.1 hypothetical protein BCU70_19525 [Vibrio sp. 10N.286.49.C2]PMH51360.1 hypothetical protein BCU66_16590 [Vibrio sp. 10N.286.49.B1]PMH78648.1 hypothetical protein BCU58_08355 [Vibrio sp. 10N.286.48.B7]
MNNAIKNIAFVSILLLSFESVADPWKKHKHHKHHKKEVHVVHHYDRHRLPDSAIFLAIAGVSYALINGRYYEERNDHYVVVEKPNKRRYRLGQVIKRLPEGATAVNKKGQQYFVSRGDWFLPTGQGRFVVVRP